MGGAAPSRPLLAATLGAAAVGLAAFVISQVRRQKPQITLPEEASPTDATSACAVEISSGQGTAAVVESAQPTQSEFLATPEQRAWAQKLVRAAAAGEAEELKGLLSDLPTGEIQDVNVQAELSPSWTNVTATFAASHFGHEGALRILLNARADPDLKCQKATQWDGAFTLTERDTALVAAAREGHAPCVQALLEARADPNVQCDSEYLEGAVEWGEDDDGTETMIYSALDAANMAKQTEIATIIQQSGGTKIVTPSTRPRRKMISQGSRMGA